jgi:hypothetical protein
MTFEGSSSAVYRVDNAGNYTTVYALTEAMPLNQLVSGGDCRLYYTSPTGGAAKAGAVYRLVDASSVRVCDDGVDGDRDGLIDRGDPGCASSSDPSEQDSALVCDDGVDNDGDGQADFGRDAGCSSASDPSERVGVQCEDGIDNDGDGVVDMADNACQQNDAGSEIGQCQDGFDNDGDAVVDIADAGCRAAADASEQEAGVACDDGSDNDGDGYADWRDPGCRTPSGQTEAPQCMDGIDNDRDGRIDFDRGRLATGSPVSKKPDKQCKGNRWRASERKR